ncbi:MAG: hypothetical protein E4G90_03325, partial [Gemmatimonadales bacterium]
MSDPQVKERLPWEPAIYEHKAALIGRSPEEVSHSANLLTAAILEEIRIYQADFVTVGIDVYNVEAQACGAQVVTTGPQACPEIPIPPWSVERLPRELEVPAIPREGRFQLLLDAARRVTDIFTGSSSMFVDTSRPWPPT